MKLFLYKTFAVFFVLLNFSLFVFATTSAYSKSQITNQENSILYERYLKSKMNEKFTHTSDLASKTVTII